MVIEAGWGLGEAIVGGKITPDTYIINKADWSILDINISEQKITITRAKGGNGVEEVKLSKTNQEKQKLDNKKPSRY